MKPAETQRALIKELSTFVKDLDPAIRLEAFRYLLAREGGEGASREAGAGGVRSVQTRDLSPQEVLRKCKVSSLTDTALVLGFWIEDGQGKSSFSSADLKDAFVRARETAPVNPSDIVAKLDGAGRIMKADKVGKAQYYRLTRTGIDEVQKWLRGESGATDEAES